MIEFGVFAHVHTELDCVRSYKNMRERTNIVIDQFITPLHPQQVVGELWKLPEGHKAGIMILSQQ